MGRVRALNRGRRVGRSVAWREETAGVWREERRGERRGERRRREWGEMGLGTAVGGVSGGKVEPRNLRGRSSKINRGVANSKHKIETIPAIYLAQHRVHKRAYSYKYSVRKRQKQL